MKYGTLEQAACIRSREDLEAAIGSLEGTPARLETLLAGLSETQLRWKPRPSLDAFSMKENIRHLRDIEVEGYARRLRRTLSEENPLLPDIDGTRLAIERRYNDQPLAPALTEFGAARRENIALLRKVTASNLARTAEMETVGRITLARLIEMWREHDAGHVAELEELRQRVGALRSDE